MMDVFSCLLACLPFHCRFESVIFTVPPVLAPLLGAMYVRSYGRKAGIMLGCIIMLIGQVSQLGPCTCASSAQHSTVQRDALWAVAVYHCCVADAVLCGLGQAVPRWCAWHCRKEVAWAKPCSCPVAHLLLIPDTPILTAAHKCLAVWCRF